MDCSTADIAILRQNSKILPSAARTLSLSFSGDPLITWLYRRDPKPGRPWGELDPLNQLWQQRRVQWCATTCIVAAISLNTYPDLTDCPAMMILKPPASSKWSLWRNPGRWMDVLKVLLLDLLQKTEEQSIDKARAAQMFAAHKQIMSRYAKSDRCWYLEVIAVNPNAQGHGLGGKLMRWLLTTIGDEADCILECTDESNMPFYEKYGFQLLEVTELRDESDPDHLVKEFIMMRRGTAASSGIVKAV